MLNVISIYLVFYPFACMAFIEHKFGYVFIEFIFIKNIYVVKNGVTLFWGLYLFFGTNVTVSMEPQQGNLGMRINPNFFSKMLEKLGLSLNPNFSNLLLKKLGLILNLKFIS